MQTPNRDDIKFYFDKECTKPIDKVKWDSGFHVTMADGTETKIENIAKAGELAIATFYVRNEHPTIRFGVHEITHPDPNVKTTIESAWLLPMSPTKITLSVQISSEPTQKDVVESANFVLSGFFVIDKR